MTMTAQTEVKHTPGPWRFSEGDKERRAMSEVFKKNDKTFQIALVTCEWSNPHARAEDIANARLIAAAPELLAACEALCSSDENGRFGKPSFPEAIQKAREAIAKAKGN